MINNKDISSQNKFFQKITNNYNLNKMKISNQNIMKISKKMKISHLKVINNKDFIKRDRLKILLSMSYY